MTPEELESQVEQDSAEIVRLRDTVIAGLRKQIADQNQEIVKLREDLAKLRADTRDGLEVSLRDAQRDLEAVRSELRRDLKALSTVAYYLPILSNPAAKFSTAQYEEFKPAALYVNHRYGTTFEFPQ